MNENDIPVTAFLSDGTEVETTLAKAIGLEKAERQVSLDRLEAGFYRMAKAFKANSDREKAEKRLTGLLRAELTRRETAKMRQKRAKWAAKSAAVHEEVAQLKDQLAKAHAVNRVLAERVWVLTSDAERRILFIEKQDEVAKAQRRVYEKADEIAALAAADQDRALWTEKALGTQDPDLRAAYYARAERRTGDEN